MSDLKMCPVCGKTMMPNPNKTKPLHPDLICSDPECKFQWDKETKQYVTSQWRTGSWLSAMPKTRANAASNFVKELQPEPTDWDAIGEKKTRCALAEAMIRRGDKANASKDELDSWTNLVLKK